MSGQSLGKAVLLFLLFSSLVGCIVNVECVKRVQGDTWIDENGNRKWDAGGSPLPGVRISFSGVPASYWIQQEAEAVSDEHGKLAVSMMTGGCPEGVSLVAVVEVPPEYWVPEPRVILEGLGPDTVQFGFIPVERP